MIEIKDLLGRWSAVLLNEEGKKETVARVVGEELGIQLKTEDVKIQNGTVFLNLKPIYKNEVFLKREKIILKLGNIFGKTSPKKMF